MKRSAPFLIPLLLLLLLLVPAASFAEEEAGPECGLFALLRGNDPGEWKIYDGIRKGLELARLPRICLESVEPWPQGLTAFVNKVGATGDVGPIFAIGDEACEALATIETTIPRVFVVQRYTVKRKPLKPLPVAEGAAVVYADIAAERVGSILLDMFGGVRPSAGFASAAPPDEQTLASNQFLQALGVVPAGGKPHLVLHLESGLGGGHWPLARAVESARSRGVPLVSDDRASFGQGAVVTLVPTQALVGRAAAEAGRRLRYNPTTKLKPRAVPSVEVWIDLHAADQQGIQLPLPFVARADKLRRSRVKR